MEGYELKNYLYIDIETLPAGFPSIDNLKTEADFLKEAPKSYSKDKQIEWAKNKSVSQLRERDEEFRKRALDSLQGRLFCIGLAYNNKPEDVIEYCESEEKMLKNFETWILKHISKDIYTTTFVGKNVRAFDLCWLYHRAIKYDNKNLKLWLPTERYDRRILDIGEKWNLYSYGKYTKLSDMFSFLEMEGKGDVDGSMVYDLFMNNEYQHIYDYCKYGDVRGTREIHKRMIL